MQRIRVGGEERSNGMDKGGFTLHFSQTTLVWVGLQHIDTGQQERQGYVKMLRAALLHRDCLYP